MLLGALDYSINEAPKGNKNRECIYLGILVTAQSVERATPGEEVPGSIPAVAARLLHVGSRCQYNVTG